MNNSTSIRRQYLYYQLCVLETQRVNNQHDNDNANTMALYTTIHSELFHIWGGLFIAEKGPFQTIEAPNRQMRLIESGNGSYWLQIIQ